MLWIGSGFFFQAGGWLTLLSPCLSIVLEIPLDFSPAFHENSTPKQNKKVKYQASSCMEDVKKIAVATAAALSSIRKLHSVIRAICSHKKCPAF